MQQLTRFFRLPEDKYLSALRPGDSYANNYYDHSYSSSSSSSNNNKNSPGEIMEEEEEGGEIEPQSFDTREMGKAEEDEDIYDEIEDDEAEEALKTLQMKKFQEGNDQEELFEDDYPEVVRDIKYQAPTEGQEKVQEVEEIEGVRKTDKLTISRREFLAQLGIPEDEEEGGMERMGGGYGKKQIFDPVVRYLSSEALASPD